MSQGWKSLIEKFLRWLGMNEGQEREIRNHAGAKERQCAPTRVLQPAYTRRLRPEPDEFILPEIEGRAERQVAPLSLVWHGMTDVGMVRPHNEDSFSSLDLGKQKLFVIADGMGGHDAGEVASRIAVDAVIREVREGVERKRDPQTLVEHAVQKANAAVKREATAKGSNMGTTLSVAIVAENTAYVANVGDSRVYWVENGSITQITEDHSLVAKLVAAGKLTKEEARNHPKSNLLYRTIGTDDPVKVDTFRVDLKKDGNLLLCTDGLWGMVADEELHRVCADEKDSKKVCAKLVEIANNNGGQDNITAIVVKVK